MRCTYYGSVDSAEEEVIADKCEAGISITTSRHGDMTTVVIPQDAGIDFIKFIAPCTSYRYKENHSSGIIRIFLDVSVEEAQNMLEAFDV